LANNFCQLWLADAEGKITTRDMERVLAAIKCEATEPKKPLPAGYNAHVNRLFRQFKEETKLRDATMDHTVAMHHAQKYLVRELNLLHRTTEDAELRGRIELLDNFVRHDPAVPLLKEFHLAKKQSLTGDALVQKLTELYFKYPHDQECSTDEQGRKLTAERIICSEALL
jgi:hypothetical protein